MNTLQDIWDKFPKKYIILVVPAAGLLVLLGAILNWDWVLEGDGRIMNIAWISNMFGRKAARVIIGINGAIIFIVGMIYFILMNMNDK